MVLLVASLVALALGPLLLRLVRGSGAGLRLLDGFIYVAIGGLVAFHVLPPLVDRVGLWAFVAAGVGLLGPTLVERRLQASARHAHAFALVLACLALAIHGFLDGVALVGGAERPELAEIGLAVVLHRLPVGLTVWWLVAANWGRGPAVASLAGIGAATVLGWGVGAQALQMLDVPAMSFCYALVGGSLLHVLFHRPHRLGEASEGWFYRYAPGLGAVLGGVLLLALQLSEESGTVAGAMTGHAAGHSDGEGGFASILLRLSYESAPALILAYLAAGLIQAWLPKSTVAWMGRGTALSQSFRGVAFGLPLPICSCGVIPVYRSLIVQGAPPAAAMSFLVATPELGLDAVLLSLPLLGGEMTIARVVCAALVALLVGFLVGRAAPVLLPKPEGPGETLFARPPGFRARAVLALRSGLVDVVDHTAPWILVGLVVAAALQPSLQGDWITQLPGSAGGTGLRWVEVLVFAILGLPVYVCASGATPLVAVLLFESVSPGAGIAFLLAGPATNITTFGVLSGLHGRRTAVQFGLLIVAVCVLLGLVVNGLMPEIAAGGIDLEEHHEGSLLQKVSLAALILLCLGSILREGPRGFFGLVFSQGDDDPCEDSDHDGHGHDHGSHGSAAPGEDSGDSGGGCC